MQKAHKFPALYCPQFGITSDNIYPMFDWVGERFSVWSAAGMVRLQNIIRHLIHSIKKQLIRYHETLSFHSPYTTLTK